MSFLFKSKKSQDRALASRDGNTGSQGSVHSASGRGPRDEKGARSTPTGSLNSLENDGMPGSPDRGHGRRGGSIDQTQQAQSQTQLQQPQAQSDLPVSDRNSSRAHLGRRLHQAELANHRILVAQWTSAAEHEQRLPLPLVSAKTHIYIITSEPVPAIWRRRQLTIVQRR